MKDKISSPFFSWDKMDWIVVDENIRRKQVGLDKLMHVLFEIKAGAKTPIHSHPHEQTGCVLRGCLKVTIGEEERILRPGEGYLVLPNTPHGVEVLGEEDALILDTFTPQREDFKG